MKYLLGGVVIFLLFGFTSVGHADIKVYFSPNGGCQEAVISEIGKAQKTIDIAMYELTSREIAQALVEAKRKGIRIRVFLDQGEGNGRYSKGRYLIGKGIDVRFYTGTGLMHNKFAIIDDKEVITGSFNWTASAEKKNSENLLILTDKVLAEKYSKQFKQL